MPPRNAPAAETADAPTVSAYASTQYKGGAGVAYSTAPTMGERYAGLLGDNFRNKSLMSRLNWLHVPLLFSTPLIALYGMATWTWDPRTAAFAVLYYFITGLGITAGAWGTVHGPAAKQGWRMQWL
jgi:hypothetical protein